MSTGGAGDGRQLDHLAGARMQRLGTAVLHGHAARPATKSPQPIARALIRPQRDVIHPPASGVPDARSDTPRCTCPGYSASGSARGLSRGHPAPHAPAEEGQQHAGHQDGGQRPEPEDDEREHGDQVVQRLGRGRLEAPLVRRPRRRLADADRHRGEITGYAYDSNNSISDVFLYSNGRLTDLGTREGTSAIGNGINASGQIAGYSTVASGNISRFSVERGAS